MLNSIPFSNLEKIKEDKAGLLLVNKPLSVSSFAVVAKVRRVLGIKKVGHAGTLDPLASGLMLILIGSDYTRKAESLTGLDKTYSGQVVLGLTSPTDDREGLESSDIDKIKQNTDFIAKHQSALNLIDHFILLLSGHYQQLPPQFSAKKVNGQRSYMRARKGQYTSLKTKLVHINILSYHLDGNVLSFRMNVSSGTYIRSFAKDLGTVSGLGGYLDSLRRESIGDYSLPKAISWEQII